MSRLPRGYTLVELLVGVALALFVVAGATAMVAQQLADQRRLVVEAQLAQDLRAAADLIARELRRAGHWGHAVERAASAAGRHNAYDEVTAGTAAAPSRSITYAYSHDAAERGAENDVVDADEHAGFKLDGGALKLLLGTGWQSLTDPAAVTITAFAIAMESAPVDLAAYCINPCAPGVAGCPPVQHVRHVTVSLTGRASAHPDVQRSLRTVVRLRNDRVVGACAE